MIYGYARTSRREQRIDRQIRSISADYPSAEIVQDEFSAAHVEEYPEFEELVKAVTAGDTIVFDSVTRMGSTAEESISLYEQLYEKGVQLVFLKEHSIDTVTYEKSLSKYFAIADTNSDIVPSAIKEYLKVLRREQILAAFGQVEKEVEALHQRGRDALDTARANGKQIGQKKGSKLVTIKSIEMKAKIIKMSKNFEGKMSDPEVMEALKISKNTYYKYKREITESRKLDT